VKDFPPAARYFARRAARVSERRSERRSAIEFRTAKLDCAECVSEVAYPNSNLKTCGICRFGYF